MNTQWTRVASLAAREQLIRRLNRELLDSKRTIGRLRGQVTLLQRRLDAQFHVPAPDMIVDGWEQPLWKTR